jgi:hypothetical protein
MAWTSIDDGASYHPKARKAGLEAWGFFVAAIVYSNKHLKDGFIARECLEDVWPWGGKLEKIAQKLAQVELFDVVDGGWRIHNYLKYQRSRDEILAQRAAEAERKKLAREQMSGKRPAGRRVDGERTDTGQQQDGARMAAGIQQESDQRPALAYAGTRASAHASAGALLSYPLPSHPDPIPQEPIQPPTSATDSVADSSFHRRALERVVGEVRGRPWSVPKQRFAMAARADEVVEEIREMAAKLDLAPDDLCALAFEQWVKHRENRNESTQPHLWLDDWAGQLPPPPKKQEKWRDLEG